ncbi:hypothetical protein BDP27DRAFT_1364606 [Rhodocollybia butyracea]|uniref:Uncharacterized protein n=1 Tax=Rhodocollybia butyracea TaxID=206335 RepID=A0A9P5U6H5_9AGAR|nr:hypothetical protein BDP27DRAFT_1364606 [Rhodocollybia butyracea]
MDHAIMNLFIFVLDHIQESVPDSLLMEAKASVILAGTLLAIYFMTRLFHAAALSVPFEDADPHAVERHRQISLREIEISRREDGLAFDKLIFTHQKMARFFQRRAAQQMRETAELEKQRDMILRN